MFKSAEISELWPQIVKYTDSWQQFCQLNIAKV